MTQRPEIYRDYERDRVFTALERLEDDAQRARCVDGAVSRSRGSWRRTR